MMSQLFDNGIIAIVTSCLYEMCHLYCGQQLP
jgi:hypothetical protein